MISVVITMFNSKNTIERCLISVLAQEYRKIEIIIIDDGSTDNGILICKQYQKNDGRIKIYQYKNHGVSWARNTGLNLAKGEFIVFVDSDDKLKSGMLKKLYENSSISDLVICGIDVFGNEQRYIKSFQIRSGCYKINQYLCELEMGNMNPFFGGPYNKLFNVNLLREHNIYFIEGQTLAEDFCFNLEVLKYVKNVYVTKECLYDYYVNTFQSLSNTNYKRMCDDIFWNQEQITLKKYKELMNIWQYTSNHIIQYQLWIMYVSKVNQNTNGALMDRVHNIVGRLAANPSYKNVSLLDSLSIKQKIVAYFVTHRLGVFFVCLVLGKRYKSHSERYSTNANCTYHKM